MKNSNVTLFTDGRKNSIQVYIGEECLYDGSSYGAAMAIRNSNIGSYMFINGEKV